MTDSGNDNAGGAGERQGGGSLIDIIADCGDGMWLDGADIVPATNALVRGDLGECLILLGRVLEDADPRFARLTAYGLELKTGK